MSHDLWNIPQTNVFGTTFCCHYRNKNETTDNLSPLQKQIESYMVVAENFNMTFATNLKHLIKERGLNPRIISEATGIPRATISDWMNGTEPRLNDSIIALSKFFGCSIDYLITGKEPEEDLINNMIEDAKDSFTEIHTGIYRLRIEKMISKK